MVEQGAVLITGGTGFLGSRVTALFLAKGYKVIVVKRNTSKLDRLSGLLENKNLSFFNHEDGLKKCFNDNKIDFIIHTATCYGREKDSFADVALTNLVLPLELLELSLQSPVKVFINIDTFFNSKLGLEPKEKSYITTKKLFLEIATEVTKNTALKFINMRIEQMYGPEDGQKKFVISILNDLLMKKASLDLTRGGQKRDFVFVDDAAMAFIKVIENHSILKNFEEFGIGFGRSVTIKSAVSLMKKLTNSSSVLNWGAVPYRKNEIMASKARVKANKKIAWKPEVSFETGLKLTIKKLAEKYAGNNK